MRIHKKTYKMWYGGTKRLLVCATSYKSNLETTRVLVQRGKWEGPSALQISKKIPLVCVSLTEILPSDCFCFTIRTHYAAISGILLAVASFRNDGEAEVGGGHGGKEGERSWTRPRRWWPVIRAAGIGTTNLRTTVSPLSPRAGGVVGALWSAHGVAAGRGFGRGPHGWSSVKKKIIYVVFVCRNCFPQLLCTKSVVWLCPLSSVVHARKGSIYRRQGMKRLIAI